MKTKFIAEISSNHFNDLDRIRDTILESKKAGCWGVKFQLFELENLFHSTVIKSNPKLLERKKWELDRALLPKIRKICDELDIKLGFTPFSLNAVDFLEKYVDFFKVASYEFLWMDLIKKIEKTNIPFIVSTGMANFYEIGDFYKIFKKFNNKPAILHCRSEYPTPRKNVNLEIISLLRDYGFNEVGWSDHTVDHNVIITAVLKYDVDYIEFHIDLDGEGVEYSKGHCWLPFEINKTIINCNKAIESIGNSTEKSFSDDENNERVWRADPSDGLRPLLIKRKEIN